MSRASDVVHLPLSAYASSFRCHRARNRRAGSGHVRAINLQLIRQAQAITTTATAIASTKAAAYSPSWITRRSKRAEKT